MGRDRHQNSSSQSRGDEEAGKGVLGNKEGAPGRGPLLRHVLTGGRGSRGAMKVPEWPWVTAGRAGGVGVDGDGQHRGSGPGCGAWGTGPSSGRTSPAIAGAFNCIPW